MRVLIVFATREGHTHRIADHIAEAVRRRGYEPHVVDAAATGDDFDLGGHAAAILAASVHLGTHEREMKRFIRQHREALQSMPSAFISVSMSAVRAADPTRDPDDREQATRDVVDMMEELFQETGWRPDRKRPVAGALMYTKYNFLVRWIMKRIAREQGGSTDTSRDHIYTDWGTLDRFVGEFMVHLDEAAAA
ncbi:MAG: hypothetical protein KC731_04715 [Myxococcales bacterium]|nr:hypothetical protein [Myxococcales bacterium]